MGSVEEFQAITDGGVTSREKLLENIKSAAALICPLPGAASHPIEAMRRPILRAAGNEQRFIQDAESRTCGPAAYSEAPFKSAEPQAIAACLTR